MKYKSLYNLRELLLSQLISKKGKIILKIFPLYFPTRMKITFFLYALCIKHDKYFSPFHATIVKQIIANTCLLQITIICSLKFVAWEVIIIFISRWIR